jgi:amino acid transporter
LGAGLIAVIGYLFGFTASYLIGGVVINPMVSGFGGPSLPWWAWVLGLLAAVSVFGYLRIDLSAKVLSVLLVVELAIVVIYDVAVGATVGPEGFSFTSFTPAAILSGSFGAALLFTVAMFSGFEVTAIFREETRDPERTVPRATYLVVATIAILYAVTTWLFVEAYGVDKVVEVATADPTGSMEDSIGEFAGHAVMNIASVLVVTSTFATVLAAHNVVARYIYNLSVDGVFPRVLSDVHEKFGSPHRASVATTCLNFLAIVPFAIIGVAPDVVYPVYVGILSYVLILVLLGTSIAIPLYMRRNHPNDSTIWHTTIAPSLAAVGFVIALVLATVNISLLIPGSKTLAYGVLVAIYAVAVGGAILARFYRNNRPDVYRRIGRQ